MVFAKKQTNEITVPYNYIPRDYQVPLYNCISDGYKRGVAVWHRRSGKDKTLINLLVKESFKRVGSYYYFYPKYAQGRKALWDGIDKDGFPFLDHIPEELRVSANSTEMKIKLINGSIFQIVGSDNIDTIVGTNPVGCVFSEFALQDPRGWDFVTPILLENDGFAVFNFTPRGHNHGYKLVNMARRNPDWFYECLKITDTNILTEHDMQMERDSGRNEDFIQQEYYCSFEASLIGAYFATEISIAREQGRICGVPVQGGIPVNTYWDLGIGDSTSIWLAQNAGKEIHAVGYYENTGEGLSHYVNWLNEWRSKNNIAFDYHVLPHDAASRQLQTGKTTEEFLMDLHLGPNISVAPRPARKEDSIEAARQIFSRCWFDDVACERGIDALSSYRKDYDEINKVFRARPVHDWASHCADAFQTLALGYKQAGGGDLIGWTPTR